MLTLFDFSAVMQVVIAFYGVYAAKSKDIGNTLIFHIIRDSIKRIHDISVKHLEETKDGYERLHQDLLKIDQKKLSGTQKDLMTIEETGAKQEVDIAKALNEKLDILYKDYIGQSYFPVLAVDIVLLSFTMLVLGVLDCKLIWNVDSLCMLNTCFVSVLVIHCIIYELSLRIRCYTRLEPSIVRHATLIVLFLVISIVITEHSQLLGFITCDIKQYMVVYSLAVLVPPVIIVGRNLRLISEMRMMLEKNINNREFAMKWFHDGILDYKKMYSAE